MEDKIKIAYYVLTEEKCPDISMDELEKKVTEIYYKKLSWVISAEASTLIIAFILSGIFMAADFKWGFLGIAGDEFLRGALFSYILIMSVDFVLTIIRFRKRILNRIEIIHGYSQTKKSV